MDGVIHNERQLIPPPPEASRTAAVRLLVRTSLKPVLAPWVPVSVQRMATESTAATLGSSPAEVTRGVFGGVPGERILPVRTASGQTPGASGEGLGGVERTILYLHGGGYVTGSARTHRPLTTGLATEANSEVVALDYRLAPEHRFPAALRDALSAYRRLVERPGGRPPALAGDSAGGGLALSLAVSLREQGLPSPRCLVLVSPWLDLTLSGSCVDALARRDPMLSRAMLERWGRLYRGDTDAADPGCSPLFADLRGLPPTLVLVGGDEVLLDDAERLTRSEMTRLTLERHEGLFHDFPLLAKLLPAGRRALQRIGAFIRSVP